MTPQIHAELSEYFGRDPHSSGIGDSDRVLALLRLGHLREAERLLGHPVPPDPDHSTIREMSDWVEGWLERHPPSGPLHQPITYVERDPTPVGPRAGRTMDPGRYGIFRVGRTLAQCLRMGATPDDVRLVLRNGNVRTG